jgi:CheY-like chemotaxis protein
MALVSGRDPRSGPALPPLPFPDAADEIAAVRQFLRHTGYEVVEASDGDEALAKAGAFAPDIIVMDLWMPRLDGWESIRRLKASPATANIPVLVLTGDAYGQARHDAEAAGCQAYMVKPCLPMDVAAAVGRLVVARRAGAEAPVRVLSERREGGRRQSETGGGVLASVVADLDRHSQELSRDCAALAEELEGVPPASRPAIRGRLEKVEQTRQALARQVEALKIIARSADVRITIPARRGSGKS